MRSLITAVLLVLCVAVAQAEALAEDSHVRVESVQADFIQEKELAILARPILSRGSFVFQAPGSLRWEYFSPIHTVLLMHDGHIRKFVQRDGVFVEESGMGVNSMQIVLQEITGWLDGEITDTDTFRAEVKEDGFIVLTPKEATLAKIISRIELKLLGQSGLMESVTLYEGVDSLTRMVFSAGVVNEKIPATRFSRP